MSINSCKNKNQKSELPCSPYIFLREVKIQAKKCVTKWKRFRCYYFINRTLPEYMNTSLRKNSDVHSRSTRNCNLNLLCPSHRNASEGGRTFAVRSIKDWNSLPRSLKTEKSVKSFKAKLCDTILNSQKTNGIFYLLLFVACLKF